MPVDIRKLFSFRNFAATRPRDPLPGDRLDDEFDEVRRAIREVAKELDSVRRTDGAVMNHSIHREQLAPELLGELTNDFKLSIQSDVAQVAAARALVAQAQQLAQQASSNALQAQAQAQNAVANLNAKANPALAAALHAETQAHHVLTRAIDLETKISSIADDVKADADLANKFATLSSYWAEWMGQDGVHDQTIPPNDLKEMGVSGAHWSARWWANKAAQAAGKLIDVYLGAFNKPPTKDNSGGPLTAGMIYLNTAEGLPYGYDGRSWKPMLVPSRGAYNTLSYNSTPGQQRFTLTVPDLLGATFSLDPVTPEPVDVYVNGVRLPKSDYTVDGPSSTVRLNTQLDGSDDVVIDVHRASTATSTLQVLRSTSTALAAQVKLPLPELVAATKIADLLRTAPLHDGDLLVFNKSANQADDQYAGLWVFMTNQWLKLPTGAGNPPKPEIYYRAAIATPQHAGNLAGDIDVLMAQNDHQINVYDGSVWALGLGEQQIKAWIASGSLFQGTLKTLADFGTLPAPSNANRGFYWTWTGSASTTLTAANFTNGGGFPATVQVGDWIQSDGTKYIHVPSDLMSKLRWQAVGSFIPWVDGSYELATLVTHKNHFYRATSAVNPGDAAPDAPASKWLDITPKHAVKDLSDVNLPTNPNDAEVLTWDGVNLKWVARPGFFMGVFAAAPATTTRGAVYYQSTHIAASNPPATITVNVDTSAPNSKVDAAGAYQPGDILHIISADGAINGFWQVGQYVDSRGVAHDGVDPSFDALMLDPVLGVGTTADAVAAGLTPYTMPAATPEWNIGFYRYDGSNWQLFDRSASAMQLGDLRDVSVAGVFDGEFLSWNDTTKRWVAKPASTFLGAFKVFPTTAKEDDVFILTEDIDPATASRMTFARELVYSGVATSWLANNMVPQPKPGEIWCYRDYANPNIIHYIKAKASVVNKDATWQCVPGFPGYNPVSAANQYFTAEWTSVPTSSLSLSTKRGVYVFKDHIWQSAEPTPPKQLNAVKDMTDVDVTGLGDGDVLTWDAGNNQWYPGQPKTTLKALDDVFAPNPQDQEVLVWDVGTNGWIPLPLTQLIKFADFNDVNVDAAQAGDHLVFDGAQWTYQAPKTVNQLSDIADCAPLDTAEDGDLIAYDATASQWVPTDAYYKKPEIDTKIAAILTGLEHGVAVQAIQSAPPTSPKQDEVYIVGPAATGAWVGQEDKLAAWDGTKWVYQTAQAKEAHLVEDQKVIFAWNDTTKQWVKVATTSGCIASATQPANPQNGDGWFDPTTSVLKIWTGTAWVSSSVRTYANHAAMVADTTCPDGVIGINNEFGLAYLRKGTEWKPLAPWVATAAAIVTTTPDSAGAIAVASDTGAVFVGANNKWNKVGDGATVSATAPTNPQTGQIWYDITKCELKVWRGTLWAAAYQQIENVGDGAFKIESTGATAGLEFYNPGAAKNFGVRSRTSPENGPEFWVQGVGNFMEVATDGAVTFPHGVVGRPAVHTSEAWSSAAGTLAIHNLSYTKWFDIKFSGFNNGNGADTPWMPLLAMAFGGTSINWTAIPGLVSYMVFQTDMSIGETNTAVTGSSRNTAAHAQQLSDGLLLQVNNTGWICKRGRAASIQFRGECMGGGSNRWVITWSGNWLSDNDTPQQVVGNLTFTQAGAITDLRVVLRGTDGNMSDEFGRIVVTGE